MPQFIKDNQDDLTLKVSDVAEKERKHVQTIYRHLRNLNGLLFGKYHAYRHGENGEWRFKVIDAT